MRLHTKGPNSLKPCAIGRSQVEESNERDPDTENRKSSDNTLRGPKFAAVLTSVVSETGDVAASRGLRLRRVQRLR